MSTTQSPTHSKARSLLASLAKRLWSATKRAVLWPRNDTDRQHYHPWPFILWKAPFVVASVSVIYVSAAVLFLLSLAFQPKRAPDIFRDFINV